MTLGPIKDIKLKSGGFSYNRLPGITSIASSEGNGAIIKPNSKSIGKIRGQKLYDVGWGYPSDLTLRPKGNIPELLSVDSLFTIGNLGIVTGGRNYIIPPTEFVVFDGSSGEFIPEIQLKFGLTGSSIGNVKFWQIAPDYQMRIQSSPHSIIQMELELRLLNIIQMTEL